MSVWVDVLGVEISATEVEQAAAELADLAEGWEARFSRFRPESELSRLNAAAGVWTPVSPELFEMIERADAALASTGGRFSPTVLDALETAGYTRSFGQEWPELNAERGLPAPCRREIAFDRERTQIRIGEGSRIDLGGIAKGVFVDRASERLAQWPGGCIDAGGDLRCWGTPPSGERWGIGIEHPGDLSMDLAVITLAGGGAVATSSTNRRRWSNGGRVYSHLIDPGTGWPVETGEISVTAVGITAEIAEIETKQLLVAATRGEKLTLTSAEAGVVWIDGRLSTVEKEFGDARFASIQPLDRARAA
jgi:thiamine biosynthesis lipoprotein